MDHQYDVYRRLRTFFGKNQSTPRWFKAWQTDMDNAKKAKADEARATAAAMAPVVTEMATPMASAAASLPAARTDFAAGDRVYVQLRGNKRVTGVIVEVRSMHGQVKLDADQCAHSNVK